MRYSKTPLQRFWEKVIIVDDCWVWTGAAGGMPQMKYGNFNVDGKVMHAHRASYELFRGPIPAGMYVCHACDVPLCVNPDHLFLGTASDNATDRQNKKRSGHITHPECLKRNESHYKTTLTADKVREIRKLYAEGIKAKQLGLKFHVASNTIHGIVKRHRWANIEDVQ